MALPEDLSKLRVVDLKEELTKRNLPTKGKKDELIARLQEALDQTADKNDAETAADATEVQATNATEEKASEPETEKEEAPLSTNPIPEETTSELATDDTAPAGNAWPDDPAVENNSYDFQGSAEKQIEHDHSPVITKESGFVHPDTTVEKMEQEDERGSKRKGDQIDASNEAKRSKVDEAANGTTTPSESVTTNSQRVEQSDSKAGTQKQEIDTEKASQEPESISVETNAVYIKGFVRPLILRHAEELAKKYGIVKKFWMDSIKTHCYVIYETVEEASAAHKNIDNIVFPPDTGRTLHVGSLSESKAEEMIVLEKEAAEKRIKFDWELAIQALPSVIAPPASSEEPMATEEIPSSGVRKSRLGGIEQVSKQLQRAAAETEKPSNAALPRQSAESINTTSLRARSVKVLSLDELFQKTKTLPALYFQPVSEEVATKRLESMHSNGATTH
ncbi:hypothetical protein K450DRAFT_228478 [Umbelopsis ramanniana AG]|uniref:SAP domain-containing protein n=1 Tax=Umbelopsis ramanniana AG TaxID=1314678 RepID=A0AAD5EG73_UMBRA|nr:uncharacterized protein K450DRAFT_228478 [Umbelopsis ramanniana AG]KAI8582326.1 hypothetical protein K450DRAFT_228478 [Umbelopsis ramanniana AG]